MLKRVAELGERLEYWTMRRLRRATPQVLVDFLLDAGLYLRPGLDTRAPERTAQAYQERAAALDITLEGTVICVAGYGGSYGVGLELLERGASRVILQDPFAPERHRRNRAIPSELRARYLDADGGPRDERLEIVRQHLDDYAEARPASVDLVVSSSVLEHVSDVDAFLQGSRALLRPGGASLHRIDLRDHYFRYPFEMLCYDEQTWVGRLNASNNLNRWRIADYQRAFGRYFDHVVITPVEWLVEEFRRARTRIRPEFLTGDEQVDAASIAWAEAR